MIIPFDFSDAHYAAYAHIWNTIFHQNPESAEKVRQDDEAREAKFKCARFFWQEEGELVGMAFYIQQCWNYQPNLFDIYILVLPSHRKQGIGTALAFSNAMDFVRPSATSFQACRWRNLSRSRLPPSANAFSNHHTASKP